MIRLAIISVVLGACAAVAAADTAAEIDVTPDESPPPVAPLQHAEPTFYVQSGVVLGYDVGLVGGFSLEGGRRIGRGPWWWHGELELGEATTGTFDEMTYSGPYLAARAGAEYRGCSERWLCGYAGIDLGFRHASFYFDPDTHGFSSVAVMPRFGFDVGSDPLRLRFTIDLISGLARSERTTTFAGLTGADANLSLALQF